MPDIYLQEFVSKTLQVSSTLWHFFKNFFRIILKKSMYFTSISAINIISNLELKTICFELNKKFGPSKLKKNKQFWDSNRIDLMYDKPTQSLTFHYII